MPRIVYIDESGDLGWTFSAPYRNGGSSRYLTIAHLVVPQGRQHIPKRVVRDVYAELGIRSGSELKGADMTEAQLDLVVAKTIKMMRANPFFLLGAITVRKDKVQEHIRVDANKLYNYMIHLSLLERIDRSPHVRLVRDNRSVKVKSGNSCVDYLQTTLWFQRGSKTQLEDSPEESHNNRNLIFIDWVSHMVWSNYEDGLDKHFKAIAPLLAKKELFF